MERRIANRRIRELLGISGRELSIKVECTKQTISNYEVGRTRIRYLERVIEIELDEAVKKCEDEWVVAECKKLQLERIRA